jgi:hypothetical protein
VTTTTITFGRGGVGIGRAGEAGVGLWVLPGPAAVGQEFADRPDTPPAVVLEFDGIEGLGVLIRALCGVRARMIATEGES